MGKLKTHMTNKPQREKVYKDIKEYIKNTPRELIVNPDTREYTEKLIQDVINIFRDNGVDKNKPRAISNYMDKNFILRT